jgi:phage terminase large subunit
MATELTPAINRFQREPDWFCERTFGDVLWSKQREILRALAVHEKVAVASCHSIGKTFIASRAALWFMHSFAPATVATTAPTGHQVENLLWKEIRTAHAKLPPELRSQSECLTTRMKFFDAHGKEIPDHIAWGRSTNESSRFQGVHAPHLMAIIDEAGGDIPDEIFEAIDTWAGGGVYRELLIGNPTKAEGKFYRAFTNPELGYHTITVPVSATPNWTGEDLPDSVKSNLVQPERVEAWKADWGEDSAAFQSRVYARFPEEGAEAVIVPLAWTEVAKARRAEWEPSDDDTLQVGVDVARFGEDRTCVASRVGMAITALESTAEPTSAPRVASMASEAAARLWRQYKRPVLVLIDETGVGGGALDICQTRNDEGIIYAGFQFGGAALDNERRTNAGAEAYWNLRDYAQAKNGYPDLVIACEGDAVERFCAQVSARRYDYDPKGRVRIEPKPKIKKRGMPSPDEADAVVMAFATVEFEHEERVTAEDMYPEYETFQLGAARL